MSELSELSVAAAAFLGAMVGVGFVGFCMWLAERIER